MGEPVQSEPFQELAQVEPTHKRIPKLYVQASAVTAVREVIANEEPQKRSDILIGPKWVRVYGYAEQIVSSLERLKENLEYEWEWEDQDEPLDHFTEE